MNTKILKTIVDVLFYLMILIQSNELIDLKSKVKEQQKQITELKKALDASAKYAESNKKAVDAAIMQKGAQLNHLGWSPIHYAAIKGNAEIVKYLLDHGAWPNSPAPDGSNPLMMSVSAGSVEAVEALVNAGADPNAVNFDGVSALDLAKERNNRKILELLSK